MSTAPALASAATGAIASGSTGGEFIMKTSTQVVVAIRMGVVGLGGLNAK